MTRPRPAPPEASVRPPRLARGLLALCLPRPHREFLLGDLEEQHAHRQQAVGARRAARWYWRQTLRSLPVALTLRWTGQTTPTSRSPLMFHLSGDLRLAVRTLVRSPVYSLVAVMTLTLAIGATTLIFSIANPILVRALPLADPATLGWIMMSHPARDLTRARVSTPDFLEWQGLQSFSALGAYGQREATLTGRAEAERVTVAHATVNLLDIWGLTPIVGRGLRAGDDLPGQPRVALLSDRYWRAAFQADTAAIGRTLLVDGHPITIVGVLPKKIELGTMALIDVWVPLVADASAPRDVRWLRPVGRLAPGASVASAHEELRTMFAAQQQRYPTVLDGWSAGVYDTRRALASDDTWVLLSLLGVVVAFVLIIACANLAHLMLARLLARRQEVDLRLALGASRWRVVRPLLVEGLLLSAAGGLLGVVLAYGGLRVINAAAFDPFLREVGIDTNVLLFAAVVSCGTPLIFALWPALVAGRSVTATTSHGVRAGTGRGAAWRRDLLVGVQVTLALSLLVVASLTIQSMQYLRRTDLGFDPAPLITWQFALPPDRYASPGAAAQFASAVTERLAADGAIAAVAVASHLPVFSPEISRQLGGTPAEASTAAGADATTRPWASWFAVSPDFFAVLDVPLLAGRVFTRIDQAGSEPVAVVSRLTAARHFGDAGAAVGRSVVIHDDAGERQVRIVGVVADTRDGQWLRTSPQIYVPFAQWPRAEAVAVVRTTHVGAAVTSVRAAMRAIDPGVAIAGLKPVAEMVDEELSGTAIVNGLLLSFAAVALGLAAAGLFGVISYSVSERRREIGVRLALGAAPMAIARMVVVASLRVTMLAAIVGVVLAVLIARLSASTLFGISPTDPATYVAVTALVIAVSVVAALAPARRAMRIDPARVLG